MIASQLQEIANCKKVIFAFGTVDPDSHMLGLTLAQMRQKEIGIQVSVGLDHVDRARAARRGGYVTHLIACSATAERLLQGTA